MSENIPTTFGRNSQAQDIPIIAWTSDFGNEVGYTPQRRCDEVSGSFQRYYEKNLINFVTTGKKNDLNIICVSSQLGGGCIKDETQGQLWTLAPNYSASDVIEKLFEKPGQAAKIEQTSSGCKNKGDEAIINCGNTQYFDVNKRLK